MKTVGLSCFFALLLTGCGEQPDTIEKIPGAAEVDYVVPNIEALNRYEPSSWEELDEVFGIAQEENKPVLIDFSGYACVNCRKMEGYVWLTDEVFSILKNDLIIASLYVDDRGQTALRNSLRDWLTYEKERYQQEIQPLYDLVNAENESLVSEIALYSTHGQPDVFSTWLKEGVTNFKEN